MLRITPAAEARRQRRVKIDTGGGITLDLPLSADPDPADLGTQHLNTIIIPGPYYQPFASRATKAQGYPWEGVAGILDVQVWNPANGNLIVTYTSWDRGYAKRTYYLGVWREWLDAFGNPIS